ncbi:EamA domain-containing membrane protein RarD [Thioclava dalianensis]|nr:DMT family transporter [Thioclava dalianensis]SFN43001.1 EamA domain-containing membrane protein RarD [Thioclava dalianensis]
MALRARKRIAKGPLGAPSSLLPPVTPEASDTARAMLFALGAFFFLTLMDAFAKALGHRGYDPMQSVWMRYAVNAAILTLIYARHLPRHFKSRHPGLQLARASAQMVAATCFFFAIREIGLAEATALADLNPVIVSLGAGLFLGERLGPHRIFGIALAFAGAMIILRPGTGVIAPGAILALVTAVSFATGMLITRKVRGDSTATSLLWASYIGLAIASLAQPFVWRTPAPADLWLFLAIGLAGTMGQFLMIRAFTMAEASTLAPFGYTGLIFASLWGFMFFGSLPDGFTILGALVIIGAGLYVWWRERRAAQSLHKSPR